MNIACKAVEEIVAKRSVETREIEWAETWRADVRDADSRMEDIHHSMGFGRSANQAFIDLMGKLGAV